MMEIRTRASSIKWAGLVRTSKGLKDPLTEASTSENFRVHVSMTVWYSSKEYLTRLGLFDGNNTFKQVLEFSELFFFTKRFEI